MVWGAIRPGVGPLAVAWFLWMTLLRLCAWSADTVLSALYFFPGLFTVVSTVSYSRRLSASSVDAIPLVIREPSPSEWWRRALPVRES
jgi:hypothetical protein